MFEGCLWRRERVARWRTALACRERAGSLLEAGCDPQRLRMEQKGKALPWNEWRRDTVL